jgi:hypothetical protein
MTSDRKKPGVAFWATVVVALVAYPLSFGPACWSTERDPMTLNRIAPRIYWPIGRLCSKSRNFRTIFNWYATISGPDYVLIVPADSSGSEIVGMSRR